MDGGEDMNDDTAARLTIDGTTSFTGNAAKNSSGGEVHVGLSVTFVSWH